MNSREESADRAERFFRAVTAHPRVVLLVSGLCLFAFALPLSHLTRDSSNMANIHPQHPARIATDRLKEIFGVTDDGSMVVLIVDEAPGGVFDAATLGLVDTLTQAIRRLEGVDPEQVTSLATEKDIVGSDWGMEVAPFFEEPPQSEWAAARVREAVLDFELYVDSLVAADGRATAIVAKLLEGADDEAVYAELRRLAVDVPTTTESVHVTGVGAFNARIGKYVEADAERLNPLAGLVILSMLVIAYRTPRGVLIPALPMLGAVIGAFGAMGALGVPVYTLNSSVSVILIAIGVCDGIHIMGQYYTELGRDPRASGRELAIRSMIAMWRPVLLTSLTTISGFLVISASTRIPPMQWYGIFATIGVLAALLVCLFAVPALLTLLPPRPSPAFRTEPDGTPRSDAFSRFTARLGGTAVRHSGVCLGLTALALAVSATGALRMQIDNSAVNYLDAGEPLRIAIDETERTLGGVTNLDVLVEADDADAFYEPTHLRKIDALQRHLETLPHVVSTRSVVDYVKQMHRAMNADRPEFYAIPEDPDMIAQYFLAYSASASPTDFEEVVTSDFRQATVRASLDSGRSSDASKVVLGARRYLEGEWGRDGLRWSLAGWANLGYHWRLDIARSQWLGLPAALLAVATVMGIWFRSWLAGLLSIVPAFLAVAFAYAVMGWLGIWMDFANSVLAALAVGVTVDFAVHTLDRLIELVRHRGLSLDEAFGELFPSTGRALLFNFAAITLGFGVLVSSHIPPLSKFGLLVVICVAASALASLTVLPALIRILQPGFLGLRGESTLPQAPVRTAAMTVCFALGAAAAGPLASADEVALPAGEDVVERINSRNDGTTLAQRVRMELIDRRGTTRVRETRSYRKYFGAERRTAIFFESPRNVRDTAFLIWDYPEPERDDDQWLYLPATRKVRRIAGSDRGRYFLGTDFTYEDVKNGTKVSAQDYRWRTLREEDLDGRPCLVLEALPVSDEVANELGYGRVLAWVDSELWMVRRFDAWDVNGNPLKAVVSSDFRQVDGIWTPHRLEASNHKTGHRTVFTISDVEYDSGVGDDLFTERALRRGR